MTPAGGAQRDATATSVGANALFAMLGATLAAAVLYPVYESPRFMWVVAFAIITGAAVAVLCGQLRWGPGRAAAIAAAAYVVGGLAIAIPSVATGGMSVPQGLLALARGPVLGWKDIVTLPLPLGEYRATLVPVLALLLVGTLFATWAATHARKWWPLAAAAVVGMIVAAVVAGPSNRAEPLSIAPLGRYLTREFVVGIAAFSLLLAWFVWRSARSRRLSLLRTGGAARLATTPRVRAWTAGAATAAVVAVAIAVAALAAGPIAAATPREVARTVVDPRLVIDAAITPLSGYRTYFDDDVYNEVMFTVTVTEGSVDRVRVATLPHFDGNEYTAAAPTAAADAPFRHVPSAIAPPDGTQLARADIIVGALEGVWVPLVGALGEIEFHGPRQAQLVDGFYYEPGSVTGIMAAGNGVSAGDSYSVRGYLSPPGDLAEIGSPPGVATVPASLIPESLSEWVLRQDVSRDGAGLAELVDRLRARGYLSHALMAPTGVVAPAWLQALPGYEFAVSPAGHSYDRIDRLFTDLLTREAERGTAPSTRLVAAIGDDEQFATAVALLAADLGFPSRVVLGARLGETDAHGWTVPTCDEGICRGRNMAVWAEVQGIDGAWTPVDVTPQHTDPPSPEDTRQRDPEFASNLNPDRANALAPPSSQRGTATDEEPPPPEQIDEWAWLVPALQIAAVVSLALLVLLGPFIVILVWKAMRRRRRRAAAPRDAIHHGWDEYLDTAVDAGLAPMPASTRVETARAYASANGATIAQLTDRATFSPLPTDSQTAASFWALIEADRAAWLAQRGWWSRLRMRLSLRSVWHAVATTTPGTTGPRDHPTKDMPKG